MPKKKKATKTQINKAIKAKAKVKDTKPLWDGPEDDGPQGGVTQSMMGSFACCRERFRIKNIAGLQSATGFQHALEYGHMWHLCEEHANNEARDWQKPLRKYAKELVKLYPTQQEQVKKWYNVCKIQFPLGLKWWEEHDDGINRTTVAPEQTFRVSYLLPSGRTVYVRGKWDGIDLVKPTKGKKELFLFEHKTKGDINEELLQHKQLHFDLQTMTYLSTLTRQLLLNANFFSKNYGPPKGFIYNVVRRPLSGGKGSIRLHKEKRDKLHGIITTPAETMTHYYGRLSEIIEEHGEEFFMRWKVYVSQDDIARFDQTYLMPMLEQMSNWYEWITSPDGIKNPFGSPTGGHWRHPYGIYNPMDRGGITDVDEHLRTGSTVGLIKTDKLFKELD